MYSKNTFRQGNDRGSHVETSSICGSLSALYRLVVSSIMWGSQARRGRTFILTRRVRFRRSAMNGHSETGVSLDSGQNIIPRVGVSRQAFKMSAK